MNSLKYAGSRIFGVLGVCGLLGMLAGCQPAGSDAMSVSESVAANASPGRIVARLDQEVIALSEVDRGIRLPLYDLERAQFDLRAMELRKLLQQRPVPEILEVFLEPPLPPRVDLPASTIKADGYENAPVTMAVFCSFQSIHCVRLQPVLQELREQYGSLIRWLAYDYPLSAHRYGHLAANAARCADAQNQYWGFYRSLFNFYDDLNDQRFMTLAGQLDLDLKAFEGCLAEKTYRSEVEADVRVGENLGLANVPVVFVNGLYISGPQPLSEYQRWINWELNRLGIQQAETPPQDPGSSAAVDASTPTDEDARSGDHLAATPRSDGRRRVMPSTGTIEISREWLLEQLENQDELARRFQAAEHEVEGYKLMRLEQVADSEFYQVLGLQDRDVLLRVDEEWLHEGSNPLWDSLAQVAEQSGSVGLVYFRNGLPQHIKVEVR